MLQQLDDTPVGRILAVKSQHIGGEGKIGYSRIMSVEEGYAQNSAEEPPIAALGHVMGGHGRNHQKLALLDPHSLLIKDNVKISLQAIGYLIITVTMLAEWSHSSYPELIGVPFSSYFLVLHFVLRTVIKNTIALPVINVNKEAYYIGCSSDKPRQSEKQ